MPTATRSKPRVLRTLNYLYNADDAVGRRFRYILLGFDIVTVLFIIATSFLPRTLLLEGLDVVFGILILAEFVARMSISPKWSRELASPYTWIDLLAIASFLAPVVGEGVGFLRVFRTVRLLRTYHLLKQLRRDFRWFRQHEDVVLAGVNLGVFLFIMTALVYETQHGINPQIAHYADALYFTVTALTTTGFGDITLPGTAGRLITVVIMILGVTLFLNLVRTILQPPKVRHRCPTCALMRHDFDAVHCKACGHVLDIPDDGLA